MTTQAYPVRGSPSVADLVTRARNNDKQAWDVLIERYAPLIWSICHRHQLSGADAEDIGQSVWLQLVDQLAAIREPAALPGWLATTTRRECCRVLRASRRRQPAHYVLDAENIPDEQTATPEHELLMAERHAALREAFADLPLTCQRLIAMLIEDPPVPYAEISATLGIPVGSIGPTRARCLNKLRRHPAVAALINDETASGDDGCTAGPQRRDPDPETVPLRQILRDPTATRLKPAWDSGTTIGPTLTNLLSE